MLHFYISILLSSQNVKELFSCYAHFFLLYLQLCVKHVTNISSHFENKKLLMLKVCILKTFMDKKLILNKIKNFYNFETDVELANFLGISRSTLSNWYTRNSLDYDLIFSKCEQIDKNWLLAEKEEVYTSTTTKEGEESAINLTQKTNKEYINENLISVASEPLISSYNLEKDYFNIAKQQIPLYEIEASAGLNLLFANQSNQMPVDYISVPNAPKCDGALFVRGDSMYPLLKSGDIVCYKHIKDIQNNIRFGEIYLLYINDGDDEYLTLKYIQESDKGEEYIKLVSENRHHSAKNEHISHIKAVALVKLSIRYNTIS